MDLTQIPFVAKVGLTKSVAGDLTLPLSESNHNHLQSVHASAQFTLAETASGEMLLKAFPELEGKVVPLLREAQVKFRSPARSSITAHAAITPERLTRFREQLQKKGRSTISVDVELKDDEGAVTCAAEFNWFVQML